MNKSSILLAAASLLCMSGAASAAIEDEQLWIGGSVNVDLGGGFRFSEETTARFSDNSKGLYQIENNFLLGYKLNKVTTIWAGYTHDPQYNGGTFTRMERRARQQITFDNVTKIGTGSLSFRVRTEQRWRDGQTGTGWRVRPFVRYSLPIANKGKTTVQFGHESFINLSTAPFQTTNGYDRMRNNVSVRTPISKVVNLEVGYLNQYQFTRAAVNKMDHAATASLAFSF